MALEMDKPIPTPNRHLHIFFTDLDCIRCENGHDLHEGDKRVQNIPLETLLQLTTSLPATSSDKIKKSDTVQLGQIT